MKSWDINEGIKMKRKFYKAIFVFAIYFAMIFVIDTIYDFVRYDSMLNSAPFSAFVIVNAMENLFPCALMVGLGFLLKKKYERENGQSEK